MPIRNDFALDNTSPVRTQILEKINDVNHGYQTSYGEDDYMRELTDQINNIFVDMPRKAHQQFLKLEQNITL